MVNIDYTNVFRENSRLYTSPNNGGFYEDELQTVLVLLREVEDEALAASDEDYRTKKGSKSVCVLKRNIVALP